MNKAISAKQLTYSIAAFIAASSLLTSNLYYYAKNDSWISVIIGYAASLLLVSMYCVLSRSYPGCTLIEINDAVFGKVLGKIVSGFYIFYFLQICVYNTLDLGSFVKNTVLPVTPAALIFSIFILICAWAVRKGPVVITRYGFLATFIVIVVILINALMLLNKIEPKNLMPVFEQPFGDYMIGAHIVTVMPFCEIMSFMMFVPYLKKPETFGRAMIRGLTIGAVTLLIVVLRDILVLGNFIYIFSMPTFSSIRFIDIGDILTRLEIVYAVILMSLLFFKVSVAYFAAVSGITRLFHIGSPDRFIYIFGALTVAIAFIESVASQQEHIKWNMTAAPINATLFNFVLPLLTLIFSILRGRHRAHDRVPSEK